ncbi:ABC transporter permease [Clostridium estertheticum]|uniref:ABC transporter permease n=1 Tax=Clostridium estertheticum TaxID=238834 RepID=A0A5N7IRU9_9CLOT|nr:ABC transporter permease [Clostridium estertheticum]MPQ32952.1 ABC transporter permease [Clostridium estertheticum]MPQ63610.1 ABC transporter permease [Clostridium estertheticum]
MNIIFIIIKEVKHSFRDKKSMAMMILFPMALIVVLSAAFNSSFNSSIDIGTPKVLYNIKGAGDTSDNFRRGFIEKGKEFKIKFTKINDIDSAKKKLVSKEYDAIIEMKSNNKIEFYKSEQENLKAGVVESILSTYVQEFNVIMDISKVNPLIINSLISDNKTNYSTITSVNKGAAPSSLDYYTIAEIALIIMYSGMTGLFGIASEKNAKTRDRILISPVKKYEFLIGKTIGGVIGTSLQIAIVIIFSKFVLHSNWGNDILTVLLIFISQIIMAISIGVGLGFIFKNENVANGVLNFMIPVMVFLGGSYMSVDSFGSKTFQVITYLSPVRWTNRSIFDVIYNNNYSKVSYAILINIGIAVVFLAISSLLFRKENV